MPVNLEVFANTGHQYFSFPLSEVASGGAKKKSGSELEALAVKNRGSFERLAAEMPWIRYQFDLAEDRPEGNRAVLKPAIETNLGLNTRTSAILLESPGKSNIPLDQRIYPLRLFPRGTQYELLANNPVSSSDLPSMLDDCAIIQSWLLLRQTLFSNSEPPSECPQTHTHYEEFKSAATGKTRYRKFSHLPQAFVEMSPALIGGGKSREGAARVLGYTDLETDAPFFLSS